MVINHYNLEKSDLKDINACIISCYTARIVSKHGKWKLIAEEKFHKLSLSTIDEKFTNFGAIFRCEYVLNQVQQSLNEFLILLTKASFSLEILISSDFHS